MIADSSKGWQIRKEVVALLCLTVISIVAMVRLTDPENIVINVVVAITSFVGGVGVGTIRRPDPPPTEFT